MTQLEYKVIPAPTKGQKAPGVKGPEARFALAVEAQMNALAAEGWAYLRSDLLPSEERQGLTSSQTVYRSVLVFCRDVTQAEEPEERAVAALPQDEPRFEPTAEPDAPPTEPQPVANAVSPVNDVPEDPLNVR